MRDNPFVFFDLSSTMRGPITYQMIKNEYFWDHLGRINEYMVENNLTHEWKEKEIEKLVQLCGWPVKLAWWQKFLANFLMM